MRTASAPFLLTGAAWLAACASSPGPAGPPEGTGSTVAVVPVAPAPTSSATQAAESPPPAPSLEPQKATCFAKPVTITASKGKKIEPADPALAGKLAACDRETDIQACRYNVAKAYFEASHCEEAGPILRDLALNGPPETGVHATMLYLDCLNVLGSQAEPARPVCYDDMATDIGPLEARHCTRVSKDTLETCDIIRRIQRDLARLRAENLVMEADRGSANAPALYKRAGDTYMALFNQYCAFRRPDVKHKPEPPPGWTDKNRCDEIAYNAIRSYMAAKEPAAAQAARAALLNPDNRLEKGELARKAAAFDIR